MQKVHADKECIYFLLKRRELIIDPAGLTHRTRSSGVSVPPTLGCKGSSQKDHIPVQSARLLGWQLRTGCVRRTSVKDNHGLD